MMGLIKIQSYDKMNFEMSKRDDKLLNLNFLKVIELKYIAVE